MQGGDDDKAKKPIGPKKSPKTGEGRILKTRRRRHAPPRLRRQRPESQKPKAKDRNVLLRRTAHRRSEVEENPRAEHSERRRGSKHP